MDAFETLVAEILWAEGYWVRTSVRVNLTKEEKVLIGRPSSPRWELDVVGYRGRDNVLQVIECKSYLDSRGVTLAALSDPAAAADSRFKLFVDDALRGVVLNRLHTDLAAIGACAADAKVQLGLACGRIATENDRAGLQALFKQRDWQLFEDKWLREQLHKMAKRGYENEVSAVVAKLLLRENKGTRCRKDPIGAWRRALRVVAALFLPFSPRRVTTLRAASSNSSPPRSATRTRAHGLLPGRAGASSPGSISTASASWPTSSRCTSPPISRLGKRLREADRQAAPRRHPHAVRLARHRPGPRHQSRPMRCAGRSTSSRRGKTPVLTSRTGARPARQHRHLDPRRPARPRADRVMTFAFARIGAVVAMRVEDYYPKGKRWWVRLHEKGGKRHEMPAHHNLEAYLDAYIEAAGIRDDGKAPLFRSAVGRTGALTAKPMHRVDAWRMVQRRAAELGMQRQDRLPHLPRDRDHGLPRSRRHA